MKKEIQRIIFTKVNSMPSFVSFIRKPDDVASRCYCPSEASMGRLFEITADLSKPISYQGEHGAVLAWDLS